MPSALLPEIAQLSVFYAPRTFEIVNSCGNREAFVQTVNSVYKRHQTITK